MAMTGGLGDILGIMSETWAYYWKYGVIMGNKECTFSDETMFCFELYFYLSSNVLSKHNSHMAVHSILLYKDHLSFSQNIHEIFHI